MYQNTVHAKLSAVKIIKAHRNWVSLPSRNRHHVEFMAPWVENFVFNWWSHSVCGHFLTAWSTQTSAGFNGKCGKTATLPNIQRALALKKRPSIFAAGQTKSERGENVIFRLFISKSLRCFKDWNSQWWCSTLKFNKAWQCHQYKVQLNKLLNATSLVRLWKTIAGCRGITLGWTDQEYKSGLLLTHSHKTRRSRSALIGSFGSMNHCRSVFDVGRILSTDQMLSRVSEFAERLTINWASCLIFSVEHTSNIRIASSLVSVWDQFHLFSRSWNVCHPPWILLHHSVFLRWSIYIWEWIWWPFFSRYDNFNRHIGKTDVLVCSYCLSQTLST